MNFADYSRCCLLICLLFCIAIPVSEAEVCRETILPIENLVRHAPIAFSGELVSVSKLKFHGSDDRVGYYELTYAVDRSWRGDPGSRISLRSSNHHCGLFSGEPPQVGSFWLIVASGNPLSTNPINGSRQLRGVDESVEVYQSRLEEVRSRIGSGVSPDGPEPINLKSPKSKMYRQKG